MKTLVIDIETTPFLSYHFNQWKVDIFPKQVVRVPEVLCFAYMWHGSEEIGFAAGKYSPFFPTDKNMAGRAYSLLCEADSVVTFNGDKFDIPHLNRLLQVNDYGPPSPYQSIDLRKTTKRAMYPYQSLNWVASELGLGQKLSSPGLDVWVECMRGDDLAWEQMEAYDRQDVRITDRLYEHQLPWIKQHPNAQLVDELNPDTCPRCGAGPLVRQGVRHTATRSYRRYQCLSCKGWSKGTRSIESVSVSNAA